MTPQVVIWPMGGGKVSRETLTKEKRVHAFDKTPTQHEPTGWRGLVPGCGHGCGHSLSTNKHYQLINTIN